VILHELSQEEMFHQLEYIRQIYDIIFFIETCIEKSFHFEKQTVVENLKCFYKKLIVFHKKIIESKSTDENDYIWINNLTIKSPLFNVSLTELSKSDIDESTNNQSKIFYTENLSKNNAFYQTTSSVKISKIWLRELKFLEENLPEEIQLFVDETSPQYVIVKIHIENSDNPYYGGVYIFHMEIPDSYPNINPKMKFMTTGEGQVRFNPNLYNCGKVCLSLLGTWSGERWDPKTSNVTQLLKSILYLVLNEEPYMNEPGHAYDKAAIDEYNVNVRTDCLKQAVIYHLKKPEHFYGKTLSDEIKKYFKLYWSTKLRPYWNKMITEKKCRNSTADISSVDNLMKTFEL
jgi:baculoviral IAP repeat-containing protein 6